jgi:hypothetical protein
MLALPVRGSEDAAPSWTPRRAQLDERPVRLTPYFSRCIGPWDVSQTTAKISRIAKIVANRTVNVHEVLPITVLLSSRKANQGQACATA